MVNERREEYKAESITIHPRMTARHAHKVVTGIRTLQNAQPHQNAFECIYIFSSVNITMELTHLAPEFVDCLENRPGSRQKIGYQKPEVRFRSPEGPPRAKHHGIGNP